MKKSILLLVFTALVLFVSGQYSRPKPIEFDRDIADLISYVDSAYWYISADSIDTAPLDTDTVNVLLIVCDTTEIVYTWPNIVSIVEEDKNDSINISGELLVLKSLRSEYVVDTIRTGNYNPYFFWIFAREVRSLSDIYGVKPYHYKFIQKDGSDLPKGYFVWDYKYLDK